MSARIAIDIDSTLHHYWDQLREIVRRRHGIDLPYEDQHTWHIPQLAREDLAEAVLESHEEPQVLAAVPYPGAVETVNGWHAAGHFIQITSHRRTDAHAATARWLDDAGFAYDELYCSYDKVAKCEEIGIDLLIDDSPTNIQRALDAGIATATITHPWNQDVCETEDVVCAADWPELALKLQPIVSAKRTLV